MASTRLKRELPLRYVGLPPMRMQDGAAFQFHWYMRVHCNTVPGTWYQHYCTCICSYEGSLQRVKGRGHSVKERISTHKTPMQPASHHCSPTRTASLHNQHSR